MKKHLEFPEHSLISELIREISEFNEHIKKGYRLHRTSNQQHAEPAFDPSAPPERGSLTRRSRLHSTIHDILHECRINIKSRGYFCIRDAVCLISDHGTLDVCLNKEIYPLIADKHRISGISAVEHSIRNSIKAAYRLHLEGHTPASSLMHRFRSRPSSKVFLLHVLSEAERRLDSSQ